MGIVTYDEYGQRRWNGRTYEEIIASIKSRSPMSDSLPDGDTAKAEFEERRRAASLLLTRFREDSDEIEAVRYLHREVLPQQRVRVMRVLYETLGLSLKKAFDMCNRDMIAG